MHLESAAALHRAANADHGVLATVNPTGAPDLVPACFAILGDPLIYINPWRVTRIPRPADAILIGNENYDNCSLADIEKGLARIAEAVGNLV